jgi:hypothetical protein
VREVLDAEQVRRLAEGLPLTEPPPERAPVSGADTPRREAPERPGIVPALGKPVPQE